MSQQFQFRPHAFGNNLFAGGIDTPRFQFVDIDGDGDRDLFILDRDGLLWFYRNTSASYLLEPNQRFGISAGSWFRFVDIDADGDLDCFTNQEFSEVTLYTNTGTAFHPQFQLTTAAIVDTSGIELFSERFSVPAFADIDGDGDLDFLTGSQSGSITLYRNVGTAQNPSFAFVTNVFNGIQIIGGGLRKPQHGASGIEFHDMDGNGTLDLFWGDYFNPSMYVLKNFGTPAVPNYLLTDSTYPKGNEVRTFGFNIPQHADINGDGIFDLMISTVFPNEDIDNLWYYQNVGSNTEPAYVLVTKNFIPMIDVGSRSSVAIADFDGDGDCDLCLSSGGGEVQIFENKGSAASPLFSNIPSYTKKLSAFYCTVSAGDLTGDGAPDLFIGEFSGGLRLLRNNSTPGNFNFEQIPFQLDSVNVGNSSAPCIGDVDHDGVDDILIGNSAGTLRYYRNIGTNSQPLFQFIPDIFNGIRVGNDALPSMMDLDGNGRNDLLIGNSDGAIARYEYNPSTQSYDVITPSLIADPINITAAPHGADLDGDGDIDLFIGSGKGGIFYYENHTINTIHNGNRILPQSPTLFPNYPNPFNPTTTIKFELSANSYVTLTIFNILGEEIGHLIQTSLQSGQHSVSWDGSGFPSGIYYYRLSVLSNDQRSSAITRPMILIK
jgi:hypothetical protein